MLLVGAVAVVVVVVVGLEVVEPAAARIGELQSGRK